MSRLHFKEAEKIKKEIKVGSPWMRDMVGLSDDLTWDSVKHSGRRHRPGEGECDKKHIDGVKVEESFHNAYASGIRRVMKGQFIRLDEVSLLGCEYSMLKL